MANKRQLDKSSFTTPAEGRELAKYATATGALMNAYKRKTHFNVRVLTRPIPISSKDAKAVLGGQTHIRREGWFSKSEPIDRITFMGRALNDAEITSVHYPWPDPCTMAYGLDPGAVSRVIMAHTQFISRTGYLGKIPAVGDIVQVNFKPGDFSYNLQYAYFDTIERANMADVTKHNPEHAKGCTKLRTKFNRFDYEAPFSPEIS